MNSKPGSISASTIPGTDEHAIAQAIDSLARKQRRGLFWDFRLWLSMGAFLSTVIVGVCVWAILSDSADTKGALAAAKAQLAVVDDVNECRSAAAVWEAGVAAQRDNLVAEGLAGVGRGQSIAGLADALDVARANATTALLARKAAVDVRCASDPSYRISDSILQPLPPPGD